MHSCPHSLYLQISLILSWPIGVSIVSIVLIGVSIVSILQTKVSCQPYLEISRVECETVGMPFMCTATEIQPQPQGLSDITSPYWYNPIQTQCWHYMDISVTSTISWHPGYPYPFIFWLFHLSSSSTAKLLKLAQAGQPVFLHFSSTSWEEERQLSSLAQLLSKLPPILRACFTALSREVLW